MIVQPQVDDVCLIYMKVMKHFQEDKDEYMQRYRFFIRNLYPVMLEQIRYMDAKTKYEEIKQ